MLYLLALLAVVLSAPLLIVGAMVLLRLGRARKSRAANECLNALRT